MTRRKFWRDWPLSSRLAVLMMLLVIIPLGSATAYSQVSYRDELQAAARAQNLQRARGTARYIDLYLQEVLTDVSVQAGDGTIVETLLRPDDPDHLADTRGALRLLYGAHAFYDVVYLTDSTGRVLAASNERFEGRSYFGARWFLNAIAGQTGVDEPRYDPEDGRVFLHVSAPVYSPEQVILGTLVARIGMNQVDAWIAADSNFAGHGELGILWDERGVILTHGGQEEQRFHPLASLPPDVLNPLLVEERYGPNTAAYLRAPLGVPALPERASLLRYDRKADPYVVYRDAGMVMQAVLVPLQSKRWVYAVFETQAAVVANVDAQLRGVIVFTAFAGILAVALAIITATWVAHPLHTMADTATALAAGDMSRRVRLARQDEVGRLGAAFDAMAETLDAKEAQLREHARDLERLVAERTADLRASEAELRALFTAMRDVIMVFDGAGRCLRIAPTTPDAPNLAPEPFIGRTWAEFQMGLEGWDAAQGEMVQAQFIENLRRCQESSGLATFEFSRPIASRMGWFLATLSPMTEDSTLCIVRNITESRDAELALRESEAKFRTLFENASDAILITTLDGRFLEVNRVACARLGYSYEELMRLGRPDITSPQYRSSVAHALQELRQRGSWVFETEHLRKDGTTMAVEVSARLMDYAGQPAVLNIARDVTERKRLEEQLRQSQKMETVGRLAGGIAHDFNNILTAIIGNVSFAMEGVPAGDAVRYDLEEAIKASRRAANLTRQLLAFSRRQMLEMKPLDLNALIQDMVLMLRRLIGEHITLTNMPASDLGMAKADQSQIEQVLVNLVVNARDAMPDGGRLTIETDNVTLDEGYVRTHPDATPGRYVRITVSDTGRGMTDEVKAHIFEPFFTTKGVGKGTGLGLATVYGIIRQHGGHIGVYSELGHGATFKVYLPRVEGVSEAPAEAPRRVLGGRETILVAEDDPSVRSLAIRCLSDLGYTVLAASDGAQGLQIAEEHLGIIHLLVTDVVMPVMGGVEFVERLRAVRPATRVLYMSGYSEQQWIRSDKATLNPFLQKPFTSLMLGQKVREVLDAGAPTT